jgi:DNA-binding NarL/FixJ family response regulator
VAVRVVVAEDDLLVREGIKGLLGASPGLEIVATCRDLPETIHAVEDFVPDVVLTDIRMPPTKGDEGIQLAASLRRSHPGVGVVVLSNYDEPAYVIALLEHGAAGRAYLLKENLADPERLVRAIEDVARGGSVVDPRVVERLVAARAHAKDSPLAGLTLREREVLAQMAEGKSNPAIATALTLTVRAVEKHINTIFSKLLLTDEPDLNRRVKAVLIFLSQGD